MEGEGRSPPDVANGGKGVVGGEGGVVDWNGCGGDVHAGVGVGVGAVGGEGYGGMVGGGDAGGERGDAEVRDGGGVDGV